MSYRRINDKCRHHPTGKFIMGLPEARGSLSCSFIPMLAGPPKITSAQEILFPAARDEAAGAAILGLVDISSDFRLWLFQVYT